MRTSLVVLTLAALAPSGATAQNPPVTIAVDAANRHAISPLVYGVSINYSAGQTRANNGIVPLNASGAMAAFAGQATGTVHLIIDVNGYFE